MGSPYDSVTSTGYNANPPSDDGSQTEANRITWAKIKTKLADVVKTLADGINTNTNAAFGKVSGGITSTAISYQVVSTDQGKKIVATAAGITITSPDATDVTSPFKFDISNQSSGDITFDGSGSQTVDGVAAITIPSGAGVSVDTDGANWLTSGQNFSRTQVTPQGYLTLVSATPVITSDQTAKTAVYYALDKGNLLPIPDGTNMSVKAFTELTLTLVSNHVASGIYDVFAFLDPADSATIRIGTGPVWTTVTAGSCARGTGAGTTELTRLKGLYVNNVAITARNGSTTYSVAAKCAIFLGSIFMDGTNGQISCHVAAGQSRKWGVSNAFNEREISLIVTDPTTNWSGTGASTWAVSRADANNKATAFFCLAEQRARVNFKQFFSGSGSVSSIGIGWNATNASSGSIGKTNTSNENVWAAAYVSAPALGIHTVNCIENSGTTAAFNGTEALMQMIVTWRA